jgi:hypothetical protein
VQACVASSLDRVSLRCLGLVHTLTLYNNHHIMSAPPFVFFCIYPGVFGNVLPTFPSRELSHKVHGSGYRIRKTHSHTDMSCNGRVCVLVSRMRAGVAYVYVCRYYRHVCIVLACRYTCIHIRRYSRISCDVSARLCAIVRISPSPFCTSESAKSD